MLPRINRLTQTRDFENIKKQGLRFQERFFGVLVLKTENPFPRFGFIVSTKISKKAHIRNRVKRLLREVVFQLLPRVKPGHDLIFLGKKELMDSSFSEILSSVENVFKKAEIIR